ncbi:hypothetical protein JCM19992_10090 [Thermostilla marina]
MRSTVQRRVIWALLTVVMLGACEAARAEARFPVERLQGFVVQLGYDGGRSAAAAASRPGVLLQIVEQPDACEKARQDLLAKGLYGRVTVVAGASNRLPYADGVVNVVMASASWSTAVSQAEIERILAPRGLLLKEKAGDWEVVFEKPVPQAIDEWTHYLHDPTNRKVAQDHVVDSPRTLKWKAGPEKSRHHDHLTSLNAMVTAGGRLFYIFDEGSRASILLPPDWKLIARDAFSGVRLWERKIDQWAPNLWPLKSMPATLPRRLVAVGDAVYVTLGIEAPVEQLDAASGETVRTFVGSERTEEILVEGDTLLAIRLTGKSPYEDTDEEKWEFVDYRVTKFPYLAKLADSVMSPLWLHADRRLVVYDRDSGEERWHLDGHFAPLSLATDGKRVYFHDGECIVACDLATGKQLWRSEPVPVWQEFHGWFGASLVVYDDVVVFAGGENMDWAAPGIKTGADDTMTAFSAIDGRKLWTAAHPPSGYRSPEDLIIAQGLVWAPHSTKTSAAILRGLDLHTGEVVREFPVDYQHGFHHRCYPGKATEDYLLLSKVGINVISYTGDKIDNNHWIRSACGYGFMPANGMIYIAPDPCNCFPEAKPNGFAALAPAVDRTKLVFRDDFEPGPAYEAVRGAEVQGVPAEEWATFRHDAERSGATESTLGDAPKTVWRTPLGKKLSTPVVAGGRVFTAVLDRCAVAALDAQSGKLLWEKAVGGCVDSSPTIVRLAKDGKTIDLAIFGATDGWLYCLIAEDGTLVWRRRLAPTDEQIVAYDRPESVWPVHGAVLVHDGLVYAAAGRTAFIDDGVFLYAVDPVSGDVRVRENRDSDDQALSGLNTKAAKPEIFSAKGDRLYMRSLTLDTSLREADGAQRHIFAPNGLLDDSWFHRAFWVYGTGFAGGPGGFGSTGNQNPSGRIMVVDDDIVYGFGRTQYGWGSAFLYRLYAVKVVEANEASSGKRGKKPQDKFEQLWAVDSPIFVRAMVKAGDTILIAGPKRLYDDPAVFEQLPSSVAGEKIKEQFELLHGGAELYAVSAADGSVLWSQTLDWRPAWDGLIVSGNRAFVACEDGTIRCLQ